VGPRTGVDYIEKRIILTLLGSPSTASPVAIPTELTGLMLKRVRNSVYVVALSFSYSSSE
jgi:hypothetical protein